MLWKPLLWFGYCLASFQSFASHYLVIAPVCNTEKKTHFLRGDNYTYEINQVSSENHGRAVSILIVPWENCGCTEVPMAGKNSCSQLSPNFIWQHILFQLVFGFLLSAFFLNPFFVLGTLNFFFFFFSLVVCLLSLFSVSCFGSEVLFTFSFWPVVSAKVNRKYHERGQY